MNTIREQLGPVPEQLDIIRFNAEDFDDLGERIDARHEFFMDLAIDMARKSEARGPGPNGRMDLPMGAVIARGDEYIAGAYTSDVRDGLPGNHADFLAMYKAAYKLGEENGGTNVLAGCTMYVTFETCHSCYFSAGQHGIKDIVFGATYSDFPDLFTDKKRVTDMHLDQYEIPILGHVRHQDTKDLLLPYHRDPLTGLVVKRADK